MNPEKIENQQLTKEESEQESPEQEIRKPSEEELNKFFNQLLEYKNNLYSPVHDLSNQLCGPTGYGQLLADSVTCPGELKPLLREIVISSSHCGIFGHSLFDVLKKASHIEKILKNEKVDWTELKQEEKEEIIDAIKKLEKVPEMTRRIIEETKSLKRKSDHLKIMASTLNFENEEENHVNYIVNSSQMLEYLVQQMEGDSEHCTKTRIADVNNILTTQQETLPMFANYKLKNTCELKLNLTETAEININRYELTRCFVNIIINSRQVFQQNEKKDGKITISTGKFWDESNHLFTTITFQDNGTGMTVEQLEKFNNQENLETTKPDGNGQGLKKIQSYIQSLGGYVKAINLPEGGLELTLFIPAVVENQEIQKSEILETVA